MNEEATPQSKIDVAIEAGATVTVVRTDGKTATGTIAWHATDPELRKVVTGRRGRPFVFHPDDIESVDFE